MGTPKHLRGKRTDADITSPMLQALGKQSAEYAALRGLWAKFQTLHATPFGGADYLDARRGYEGALRTFLDSTKQNGRK